MSYLKLGMTLAPVLEIPKSGNECIPCDHNYVQKVKTYSSKTLEYTHWYVYIYMYVYVYVYVYIYKYI